MIEIHDNIWKYKDKGYIVIPTNGFVKSNGCAVMGCGLAQQCAERYPQMPEHLGTMLEQSGNHVFEFKMPARLITFPVKTNWWEKAKQHLIQKSCQELLMLIGDRHVSVFLPRVGCGNGQLDWEKQVKPILKQEFVNCVPQFFIVDNTQEEPQ